MHNSLLGVVIAGLLQAKIFWSSQLSVISFESIKTLVPRPSKMPPFYLYDLIFVNLLSSWK